MSGCRGKRKHPTWDRAVAAAIRLSRANRPLRVYRCPHRCPHGPHFHLTSLPAYVERQVSA